MAFVTLTEDDGQGNIKLVNANTTGIPFTALTTTQTVSSGITQCVVLTFMNLNATPAYLELFDTTGAVTLGSTTPNAIIPIPSNATAANGSGTVIVDIFMKVLTGTLKVAAVTAAGGNTAVSTGIIGTIWVK